MSENGGRGKRGRSVSLLKALIVLAILFFIGKSFFAHSDELSRLDISINLLPLLAGFLIIMTTYFYIALVWHILSKNFGADAGFRESLLRWSTSQFARYIPGTVFVLVSRFISYRNSDLTKSRITSAFLLENAIIAYSALMVFLVFGWSLIPVDSGLRFLSLLALPAGAAVLVPGIPKKTMNSVLRLFGKDPIIDWPGHQSMLKCLLLGLLAFVQSGIGFFLVINSIFTLDADSLPLVIGAFSGAGVVNLLVFFVPGGLGARDGALALFLSSVLPVSVAILLALVIRVLQTIMEVLVLITGMAWCSIVRKRTSGQH